MNSGEDSKLNESGRDFLRRSLHTMMNKGESNPEGFRFHVPNDGVDTEIAAEWLRDPALMLKQLTDSLDGYCNTYFDYDYLEAKIDSRDNVTPERSVFSLKPQYNNSLAFVIAQSHLQNLAKAVESVRDINSSVPFSPASLVNLGRASMPFNATKFSEAVSECTIGLRRLARWVKLLPPTSEVPQQPNRSDLADELNLVIDTEARTVRRSSSPYSDVQPVRLTAAIWALFIELLNAGSNGTTADSLTQTLSISNAALAQRKNQLKIALFALGICIPDNRYRLADT